MKIQLKRSNVLESSGELAVNYNTNDPAIFLKDSNNQIIRIAGAGYDYNDLDNLPTIGDGEITIEDADGSEVGSFTVNQTGDATITLPAVGDGEISIQQNNVTIGSFTVNQTGDTVITLPDTATISPPSTDEPGSPSNGDIWIDSNECPPVLKIWSDCDGTGQWYELTSTGPKPINPQPGEGDDTITPPVSGGGTQVDPYILTPLTVSYGATGETVETITLSNQNTGNLVEFIDNNSGANGVRFEQPVGVVGANGTWSGKLYFEDTPTSSADGTFTGLLSIGSIYYQWAVTVEPALSLAVAKGSIAPASGEAGDTFTGSAVVTDAVNPVEINVFYLDGVEVQRGSSTTYFATETGELTYRKEVTDDNNQSAVIGELSDPVTVLPATKPTAVMSGLRFDSARTTHLNKGQNGGNGKLFTISTWIKPTNTDSSCGYISADVVPNTTIYSALSVDSNNAPGKIRFVPTAGANGDGVQSDSALTLNKWHHIVVAYDSAQANQADRCKMYIDGVAQSTVIGSGVAQNTQAGFCTDQSLRIGVDSKSRYCNGYMSDVYLVDGEALEPEAFGKSFEGKWGPLDSAVVLENIKGKTKSPYEERPNMDQKWSDYAVSNGLEPWTKAFDGVISTSFNTNEATSNIDETPIVWTHTGTKPAFTKLEVWANRDYISEPSSGKITINSFDVSDQIAGNTPAWYEIDLTGASNTTTLESITLAGYNTATSGQGNGVMRLGGVRLDGRILVDGPADNSQNWSDYSTAGDNPSKIFNGNITNPYQAVILPVDCSK